MPRRWSKAIWPRRCSRLAGAEDVRRTALGLREEPDRRVQLSGIALRPGGRKRASRTVARVRREMRRALEQGGGSDEPAARPGPARRLLQFRGDLLVGGVRRLRPVPRAPVRVGDRVGRLGQRSVDVLSLRRRRHAVGRGPNQRMPEADPLADLDEPPGLCRGGCIGSQALNSRCPPQDGRVAERLGRGRGEEPPAVRRERLDSSQEALLQAAGQRQVARLGEDIGELRNRPGTGELDQGEWVSARLGEDAIPDTRVERRADHGVKQRPGVRPGKAADRQVREARERRLVERFTNSEDHGDAIGEDAARDECDRLRRDAVQPMGVVDDTYERPVVRSPRKEVEDRQTDEESVRGVPGNQPERRSQSGALWLWKPLEIVEERHAQLVETAVRNLHLRLDSRDTGHPAAGRVLHHVLEQRRLADPSLAAQDEGAARSGARRHDEPVQRLALGVAAPKMRPWLRCRWHGLAPTAVGPGGRLYQPSRIRS